MKKKPLTKEEQKQQNPLYYTSTDLTKHERSPLRNTRRAQQISSLHQQFEDLKKKIKQVESKNQKIIQKIHKAFSFKKKGVGVYTQEYLPRVQHQKPVVYYQQNYLQGSAVNSSQSNNPSLTDQKSNLSDQSEYEYRMKKQPNHQEARKPTEVRKNFKNNQYFNFSAQFTRDNKNSALEQDLSEKISVRLPNQPTLINRNSSLSNNSKVPKNNYQSKFLQLEESLGYEKAKVTNLISQLQQKETQVYALQNIRQKYKGYSQSAEIIFENTFDYFIQNYVRRVMAEIQRALKKNENKVSKLFIYIENLKQQKKDTGKLLSKLKINTNNKNREERNRVSQNLERQRQRPRRSDVSKSRSKLQQGSQKNKKNKQFEQIAIKYQEIIRNKNQQIQKVDKKIKIKQKQCYQLKIQMQLTNQKLLEAQNTINNFKSNPIISTKQLSKVNKSDESEYNLLESFKSQSAEKSSLIVELEKKLNEKQQKILQLTGIITSLEDKNSILHSQYQENITKNRNSKNKVLEELQAKNKTLEKQFKKKDKLLIEIQQSVASLEKKYLQKECEVYGVNTKVQKLQHMIEMKDKKIDELEKIFRLSQENQNERSNLLESDNSNSNSLARLKEQIESLEEQVQSQQKQILKLNREKEGEKNTIIKLVQNIKQLKQQNQNLGIENAGLRDLIKEEKQIISDEWKEEIENNENQQIVQLMEKNKQLTVLNNSLKTQNLQLNSKLLKMTGELDFFINGQAEKDKLIEKYKTQIDELLMRHSSLEQIIGERQSQLQFQRKENQQRIQEIQKQWKEFQSQRRQFQNQKSEKSSIMNSNIKDNHLITENQYLTQKLREAESNIELLNSMEAKIIQQYQSNLEKIRNEAKQKANELEKANFQLLKLRKMVVNKEVNKPLKEKKSEVEKQSKEAKDQNYFGLNELDEGDDYDFSLPEQQVDRQEEAFTPLSNIKKDENFMSTEQRNEDLENQLRQARDINVKLTQMSDELFEQIKVKQQQKQDILRILENRNLKIQELQELLELKDMNFSSNISGKSRIKQTMKSHSSLKYSMTSQVKHDKTVEFDLSQAGSSFFENSQIQNISQMFEKEEFPYEKMKLKRKEQIKLLEKTSSYIKTLKKAIDEKNKRIRILQKKIDSLRSSELVRKDYNTSKHTEEEDSQNDSSFKDYESVQLEYKKGRHHRRYKILEHDTKLVIEENNMLSHQIQNLQEELLKAEQQQNSLVKIKDLYKEEIKKVIKKNQDLTKSFEQQIQRYRQKIQESQSVHNFQAIKQLFVKLVGSVGMMQEESKGRKKEEKKKQLQEYIKVMCSILRVDTAIKDKLIMGIRS